MRPGVEVTELASGLRVASELRPDVHGVAFGVWIRCGSRDEEASAAGASHLLEHVLFRGSDRYDAFAIATAFDRFGAELQAGTSREETDLYARVLGVHLPQTIDIVGSMVARPTLDDVEAEREIVLEEIALYDDTPDELVHDELGEILFPDQPVGRPIAGYRDTVAGLDRPALAAHHARHYRADQVVIAAAGDLEHVELVHHVERAFDGLAAGGASPVRAPVDAARSAQRFVGRETEQTHIAIGGPGIGRKDERRFAMAVLDQILGGGASSRLWQEIREQRGLVYSVYSQVVYFDDAGQVGIALGTRPENVAEALAVAAHELRALAEGRFHEGELEIARENLKARLLLAMDSTAARMSRLGRSLVSDVPLMTDEEVARRIDAVTAEDVRSLVEEVFVPEALSIAGIGSDEDAFAAAVDAFRTPVGGAV